MNETCGRCGRRLKNPLFREIGYGRTCAAKLGIVIPTNHKSKNPPPSGSDTTAEQNTEGR